MENDTFYFFVPNYDERRPNQAVFRGSPFFFQTLLVNERATGIAGRMATKTCLRTFVGAEIIDGIVCRARSINHGDSSNDQRLVDEVS